MIIEDYVSYEVAKLLKKKGFDGESYGIYIDENTFEELDFKSSNIPETSIYRIIAPTHQLAMKWLRKEHNILLFLLPAQENGKLVYLVEVWTWNEEEGIYESTYAPMLRKEPEQAVESALKYCLENLI